MTHTTKPWDAPDAVCPFGMNERDRPYHEVSMLFPLLEGAEFEQLKDDIAKNGLLEPIWLHPNGSIIDGRNRHRACVGIGIEPRFRMWDGKGSLVSFIVSLNLHRRHLTSSQRAVIALDVLPLLEAEAKERQGQRTDLEEGADNFPQRIAECSGGEAREKAAEIANTNRQYVSDAKRIQQEAPDLLDQVRKGILTIPRAKEQLRNRHTMDVMGSSESREWYTPQSIIDLTLELFGEIDLDPCSNSHNDPNVPARMLYTKEDDGLTQKWHGRVYMNPPYGTEIPDWTEKLVESYEQGNVQEAIALLPGRIDTRWFQPLYEYPICNIRGRLQFVGSKTGAPFPSVVVYLGKNEKRFVDIFGQIGPIVRRIDCEGNGSFSAD